MKHAVFMHCTQVPRQVLHAFVVKRCCVYSVLTQLILHGQGATNTPGVLPDRDTARISISIYQATDPRVNAHIRGGVGKIQGCAL